MDDNAFQMTHVCKPRDERFYVFDLNNIFNEKNYHKNEYRMKHIMKGFLYESWVGESYFIISMDYGSYYLSHKITPVESFLNSEQILKIGELINQGLTEKKLAINITETLHLKFVK